MVEYYTTTQVAKEVGITRQTLLRWFKEGKIKEVQRSDRNWRLFTREDIEAIRKIKGQRKPPKLIPKPDPQPDLFTNKPGKL